MIHFDPLTKSLNETTPTFTQENMHTTNFFKTFEILTPRLEKIMEHLCMQCTVSDDPDVLVREGDPDRLFQEFARHLRYVSGSLTLTELLAFLIPTTLCQLLSVPYSVSLFCTLCHSV